MNIFKLLLALLIAMPALAQEKPLIGFEELIVLAEENAQFIADIFPKVFLLKPKE